jgi:peroxiredoxin
MNRRMMTFALCVSVGATVALAAEVGRPAPAFTGQGADGKTYKLADLKGKHVVLEWHNAGCPFVVKHYDTGNMQKLQKHWTGKGVAWFKVCTSPPGKQGYVTAEDETKYNASKGAAATASLLDHDGKIGKAYGAKTTPHMFVIDPQGTLIYAGAIDDKSGRDKSEVRSARNYVAAALEESMAGKKVSVSTSKPYGCGVKYP